MFDKQMEKKLNALLQKIDPKKLEKMKAVLNNAGSGAFDQVDAKKVEEKAKEFNLSKALGGIDIQAAIAELKKNPQVLEELKKKL